MQHCLQLEEEENKAKDRESERKRGSSLFTLLNVTVIYNYCMYVSVCK